MIKQEEVLRVFIRLFQQIPSTDFKTVTVPIQLVKIQLVKVNVFFRSSI